MSLTVFLALCVPRLRLHDSTLLFQWIYGEKRRAFARQSSRPRRGSAGRKPASLLPGGHQNLVPPSTPPPPAQASHDTPNAPAAKWPTGVPSGASIALLGLVARRHLKPSSAPRPTRVPNVILPA